MDVATTYTASDGLDIIIPAFDSERDLRWSGNMTHCGIQLRVFTFDFGAEVWHLVGRGEQLIPLRTPEKDVPRQHWHFDVSEPAGTVAITGLSLEYMRGVQPRFHLLNNKELHPAAILDAFVV